MLLLGHSHGGVVAQAYAAAYPDHVEKLVLASTLARFAEEQTAAMEAGINAKADEPWYADALAALEAEQEGRFESDEELADLAFREFPFYFARYSDAERAYWKKNLDLIDGVTTNEDFAACAKIHCSGARRMSACSASAGTAARS